MKQTIDIKQLLPMVPMAAVLTAVFLWGSSFSAMRIVLNDLTPMAAIFLRLFIASLCIIPFAGKLIRPILQKNGGKKNRKKGDWKLLGGMVLFQPCLYFAFESRALIYTTSSQAAIVSACLPLMAGVAAWIFLSEAINAKVIIGLVLSITGVILLTLFQNQSVTAPNPILGNLLELMAMVAACGYMILVKQLSSRYNTWTLTALQVMGGTLFFLPGVFPLLSADPAIWTLKLILLLLFLGPCVSLGAFGLYNYGIRTIAVSKASICINLIPVIAMLLGWLVLGETLNFKQGVAVGIVILGVVISQHKGRQ
ncbi:MAG: DMT family transporter [Proteobacteria bacterium]|nr:DMT family transporter [Pseudomonadota bacterium]